MATSNGGVNTAAPQATICFVCTGNTCRSFMAEYAAKDILQKEHSTANISICSRGVAVRAGGEGPATNAVQVLSEKTSFGKNVLQQHRATALQATPRPHDLPSAQGGPVYYLCMTSTHRQILLQEVEAGNIRMGGQEIFLMMGDREDLPDPYGGPLEEYAETFGNIEKWVKVILPNVVAGKQGKEIFAA